jgi:hypothetical protein
VCGEPAAHMIIAGTSLPRSIIAAQSGDLFGSLAVTSDVEKMRAIRHFGVGKRLPYLYIKAVRDDAVRKARHAR